jgi:hypothetical protein
MKRQRRTARTRAIQTARKLPGVVRVYQRCGVLLLERYPMRVPGSVFMDFDVMYALLPSLAKETTT